MLGQAEVKPATREVCFHGRRTMLEPRIMQVLVVLAHANGEVVSRGDLVELCWGGRIVTEDAVTRVLSKLRRVADDLCQGAFTVQSIRSAGCRLVIRDKRSRHRTLNHGQPPICSRADRLHDQQRIGFCRTDDDLTLAYGRLGQGPPLVKAPNWHGHLEHELENPLWRYWIEELSSRNTLLRYDQRGTGMSDWSIPKLSFNLLVDDFTTVVDAAGMQRFDLLAISQGTLVAGAIAA